jgi:O-antigen chain-terminating methyltransferase
VVRECREKGLDVVEGDLVDFLRAQAAGSLGGVFAAQVAEHLPPPVLVAMLAEAHRALRPGGLLLLETVNPRSVTALLEVYNRDLTHERPLHPDTLLFLAGAAGFTDARVEMRTPVSAESQLRPVPTDGLPRPAAAALNENVARLNALLYGHLEYALVARR